MVAGDYTATAVHLDARHQIPPPPPDFTGRTTELTHCQHALAAGTTLFGFSGMGGVGKTTLAYYLAAAAHETYSDAQLVVDLHGTSTQPRTAAEIMASIIHAYAPQQPLPDDPTALAGMYRSVLHDQRAIILFDNAADATQLEPLLPLPSCLVLVTSRTRVGVSGMEALTLEPFTPDEATTWLQHLAPRVEAHAGALARLCGYLPLALRLAGQTLHEYRDLTPERYIQRLRDAQQRFDQVDAAISVSYELLSHDVQLRWRSLAVFPASFFAMAATDVWNCDDTVAQNTLSQLLRHNMIGWDATLQRYQLHDLMRLFARRSLTDAEYMTAAARHATHYQQCLDVYNTLFTEGREPMQRALVAADVEAVNILTGYVWARDYVDMNAVARELCVAYPLSGTHIFHLRQQPKVQILWLELALSILREREKSQTLLEVLNTLGIACMHADNLHIAQEYWTEQIALAEELEDLSFKARALSNLGTLYSLQGDIPQALRSIRRSLWILRQQGDRHGIGVAWGELGRIYLEQGQLARAERCQRYCLTIMREYHNREAEGRALLHLGHVCLALQQVTKAKEYFEQRLAIATEMGHFRGMAAAHNGLGNVFEKLNEEEQAIYHYEAAIDLAQIAHDQRTAALTSLRLGGLLRKRGDAERLAPLIPLIERGIEYIRGAIPPQAE